MKKTPWFPGRVKPVRDGVYERDYGGAPYFYCLFKDGYWMCYGRDKEEANQINQRSPFQNERWRGLAKEPK